MVQRTISSNSLSLLSSLPAKSATCSRSARSQCVNKTGVSESSSKNPVPGRGCLFTACTTPIT